MARLFFALWPDADAAQRLARLAGELAIVAAGRAVPVAKAHLTLAFLGEVAPGRIESAGHAAAGVPFEPFEMSLDCVGWFRAARVAWAGSLSPSPALLGLQADLAARLRAAGFTLEERAFAPHMTLVRNARRAVPGAAIEPIAWRADAFSLVRSETGSGRYATLEAYAAV